MLNGLLLFSIAICFSSTTWRNNKLLVFPVSLSLCSCSWAFVLVHHFHIYFVGVTGGQIFFLSFWRTTTSLLKTWTVLKSLLFNFKNDLPFEFNTSTNFDVDNLHISSENLHENHHRHFTNKPTAKFIRTIGYFSYLMLTWRSRMVHTPQLTLNQLIGKSSFCLS